MSRNVGSTAGRIRKERKGGWKCVLFVINTCDVYCAVFWYEEIKVVIMPNWATRHEDVLGSGDLASRILNLGTWMRWMVGSASWPLYNPMPTSPLKSLKEPRGIHYGRRKGGCRKRSRHSGGISCPFEACHPRCVNSVTILIMYYTYSHNTTIFPMSNIQLHWVQLHVSALCIGHHQVVHRFVEELYNKRVFRRVWGVVGRDGPTTPSTNLWTTWWWPIHRAEACSCTQCNCILLIENIVVLWLMYNT